MRILFNFSLKSLNSFGFDVKAEEFVSVKNTQELLAALTYAQNKAYPVHILGGGSNILIRRDLPGLTIQLELLGKQVLGHSSTHILIDVAAGENWHDFVTWTLAQGYPGLENLALIPGTCGAAPIQNIGAYGVEVGTWIDSVEVLDVSAPLSNPAWLNLSHQDCQFSYRHSIFKEQAARFIVTKVRFKIPQLWQANLQYAELAKHFLPLPKPGPEEIFAAVCQIRQRKLPSPHILGNAGSFFHNPQINATQLAALRQQFPELPAYLISQGDGPISYKIPAAYLIDQCGFRGARQGQVGVYDQHALVLVNHGGGTGAEVLALARQIQKKIHAVYGVDLTLEPIVLPHI